MDRFILFYLQAEWIAQKYSAYLSRRNACPRDIARYVSADSAMNGGEKTLQATSLRKGRYSLANFCSEHLIFQRGQIDLHIGERAGNGSPGQSESGSQI